MDQVKKIIPLYFTGPKIGKSMVVCGCEVVKGKVEVDSNDSGLINNLKKYYQMSEENPGKSSSGPIPIKPTTMKPSKTTDNK